MIPPRGGFAFAEALFAAAALAAGFAALFPRFFRLGRSDDGVLICRGDSGGPVFDADLRLAGVVYGKERSDGRSCGSVAQAVRIAPQRGWLDGVLRRWGG